MLEEFTDEDGEVRPLVWLALADTQSRLGRLSDRVKELALSAIGDGSDLAEWNDASLADRRKRQRALEKLMDRLNGQQPPRRKVRRDWKYRTDLAAGDVLSLVWSDRSSRLLRVVGVDRQRYSDFVLVELLRYKGSEAPTIAEINAMPALQVPFGSRSRECRWAVAKAEKAQPDWDATGFTLVGKIAPRPGDDDALNQESSYPLLIDGSGFADLAAPLDALSRNTLYGFPYTYWEHMAGEIAEIERVARYGDSRKFYEEEGA